MKIYLAARYGRRAELQALFPEIKRLGHTVVSSWVSAHQSKIDKRELQTCAPRAQMCAQRDFRDLAEADLVLSFTGASEGSVRGGRHVEFGMGIGWGKHHLIVGPRETIFHTLPWVRQVDTWEEAVEMLRMRFKTNKGLSTDE